MKNDKMKTNLEVLRKKFLFISVKMRKQLLF
jgi:hypothetical protein